MTYKNFKKTLLASLVAIVMISAMIGVNQAMADEEATNMDKNHDPNQKLIQQIESQLSNPSLDDFDNATFESYFPVGSDELANLNALGNHWEILSVDYTGSAEPFSIDIVTVTARLIESDINARYCGYDNLAVIDLNAETHEIIKSSIPKVDSECREPVMFGGQPTESNDTFTDEFATHNNRAFLIAGQGNAGGNYGSYGAMKIPTFDESGTDTIYSEQDKFIGYLMNQSINGEFFQVGWTATGTNTNLGSPDKYLIFVDEYTYGNLSGHEISNITWQNNGNAWVYIQCGANNDYYIYMAHNGKWFSHDTNYNCNNTNDSSSLSNSVFLENANTVLTSEWSDEITSTVKAWNMREFDTKFSTSYWDSSSNTYEDCNTNTGSTTDISGNLASGGTATWDSSQIDDC